MTEAYPLAWPQHKQRSAYPSRASFKTTFEKARMYLSNELKLLDAKYIVISTNIPLRNDGYPYANHAKPTDKGVAVYFQYKNKPMCFACDRWDQVEHNIQAIGHTIAALRGISRWGSGDMLEAAFTGFQALAAPRGREWWDILGCPKDAPADLVENHYKSLARKHHPDVGGSFEKMAELNNAIAQARSRG